MGLLQRDIICLLFCHCQQSMNLARRDRKRGCTVKIIGLNLVLSFTQYSWATQLCVACMSVNCNKHKYIQAIFSLGMKCGLLWTRDEDSGLRCTWITHWSTSDLTRFDSSWMSSRTRNTCSRQQVQRARLYCCFLPRTETLDSLTDLAVYSLKKERRRARPFSVLPCQEEKQNLCSTCCGWKSTA